MSELFLELFSEEIPPKLQIDAREKIKSIFVENLKIKNFIFKTSNSFSTPTRLVFVFDGIPDKIDQKEKILKGPKIGSPQIALDGFINSNNLNKSDIYEKDLENGRYYFAKSKSKTIDVFSELKAIIPNVLKNYSWKKAMKWSTHDLSWGRPLKSIVALFGNKTINFNFFHLNSNNLTSIDEMTKEKEVKINSYKSYLSLLKKNNIILDNEKRKKIILSLFFKICKRRQFKNEFDQKLIQEVSNLVENPNIILGKFDKIFLKIPQEILVLTMQHHQKYFPLFNQNNLLTNYFLIVTNMKDQKGYIKTGNERVIKARFSDASFFWEKNKKQNLIKQVIKLKTLSLFAKLGSLYDKTQRLKKLGSLVSDHLNFNKEKIEIAASLCKADLISDLVKEYPELQGVMGKYFAEAQGFDQEISLAINEHYLPIGTNSFVPKKPVSCAVAIADKLDTLVGFFGINEKPTSSKDPFALRRCAIGLLRIIFENNLTVKFKELINYSQILYSEQNIQLNNKSAYLDIINFLRDRTKNLLKEKKIRNDIIEAAANTYMGDEFLSLYDKCLVMNKNFSRDIGKQVVSVYKRVSNIVNQESAQNNQKIEGRPNSILFKKQEEKLLFEKINEIRKYFSKAIKYESYEQTLKVLAETKLTTDNFFDNVIVNDENSDIKKNRLELLQMFCKTYNNFIDFSKIEGT